jgi:hypothetical protein
MDPVDKLKMLFGLLLLISLVTLAVAFGLGRVEEKTSYGLMPIITTLSTLAGLFGGWAFRETNDNPPPRLKQPPKEKGESDDSRNGEG